MQTAKKKRTSCQAGAGFRPPRPFPLFRQGRERFGEPDEGHDGYEREHRVLRSEGKAGEPGGEEQEATIRSAVEIEEEGVRKREEEEGHSEVDLLEEQRVEGRRGKHEEEECGNPCPAHAKSVRKAQDTEAAEREKDDVHEARIEVPAVCHPHEVEHLHPEREVRFNDVWQGNGMAGSKEDRRQPVMVMERVVEEGGEKDKRQQEEGHKA